MSPYLTLAETADLVRLSSKRIRNLMASGILVEGFHYTRPRGVRPRFKRDAVMAWIEGRENNVSATPPPVRKQRSRSKVDLSLIHRVQEKAHGM